MTKHSTKYASNKTPALLSLILLIGAGPVAFAQTLDFADVKALKKSLKPSFESGGGTLTIAEGAVHYTVDAATEKDFQYLLYQPARLRASQDFTVTGRFRNDAIPEASTELASVGIEIYQAEDLRNRVAATLSVARLEGFFSRTVFTQIVEGGEAVDSTYTPDLRVPIETSFRLSFDADAQVFTVHYDSDPDEAEAWTEVGSFGINGDGGETGNARWRMRSSEKFLVYIYGYSENMNVYEGDVAVQALSIETN